MIRNLTPHPIRIISDDGRVIEEFPPDGPPVRLAMIELGSSGGFELVEFGHAHDLPPKQDGVWLIVSLPVALACVPGRPDLVVPYREVRNDEGTVIGCRMLAQPV